LTGGENGNKKCIKGTYACPRQPVWKKLGGKDTCLNEGDARPGEAADQDDRALEIKNAPGAEEKRAPHAKLLQKGARVYRKGRPYGLAAFANKTLKIPIWREMMLRPTERTFIGLETRRITSIQDVVLNLKRVLAACKTLLQTALASPKQIRRLA